MLCNTAFSWRGTTMSTHTWGAEVPRKDHGGRWSSTTAPVAGHSGHCPSMAAFAPLPLCPSQTIPTLLRLDALPGPGWLGLGPRIVVYVASRTPKECIPLTIMATSAYLRARLPLLGIGLLAESIYVLYFVRSFPLLSYFRQDIDMGAITGHSHAGFSAFVIAFAFLFLLLGAALWLVRRDDDPRTIRLILGIGAIFALTMTFVYPVTAIDIFTYVAQSRILVFYHQNPIFIPPAQFPADPIMPLSDGWSTKGAPYGPFGILIDAVPAVIAGDNLLLALVLTKLMFSGMMLGAAYVVYSLVRRLSPRHALGGAVLLAWNPLVLFEISANGHNDAAMLLLALVGLEAMVEGEYITGTLAVTLSALVKYGTVLLLPLVIVHALTRSGTRASRARYVILAGGGSLVLTAALYKPFWEGTDTLARSLFENNLHTESFGSVLPSVLADGMSVDTATFVGRLVFVPVYLLAVWLASRDSRGLLLGCFLALFGFLALGAANFKIWYATWPTAFAASTPMPIPRIAAILLGCGATISASFYGYLWVWDNLQDFSLVNLWAYLASFAAAAVVVGAPAAFGLRRLTDDRVSRSDSVPRDAGTGT